MSSELKDKQSMNKIILIQGNAVKILSQNGYNCSGPNMLKLADKGIKRFE